MVGGRWVMVEVVCTRKSFVDEEDDEYPGLYTSTLRALSCVREEGVHDVEMTMEVTLAVQIATEGCSSTMLVFNRDRC